MFLVIYFFVCVFFSVTDIDVKFPYRKVTIKRGEDAKQYYELNEEIGR